MGTKFAPTYDTLVLGFLEQKLYDKVFKTFGPEFTYFVREFWKRYLDDCFIFWQKSNNELQLFQTILNNLHPDINFTILQSTKELPFLDVMIKQINGQISTDIFYKETDSK